VHTHTSCPSAASRCDKYSSSFVRARGGGGCRWFGLWEGGRVPNNTRWYTHSWPQSAYNSTALAWPRVGGAMYRLGAGAVRGGDVLLRQRLTNLQHVSDSVPACRGTR
jgi:hypothetical protein